jgi:hypothetical protein
VVVRGESCGTDGRAGSGLNQSQGLKESRGRAVRRQACGAEARVDVEARA